MDFQMSQIFLKTQSAVRAAAGVMIFDFLPRPLCVGVVLGTI